MIDLGSSNANDVHIGFGDLAYLNELIAFSVLVRFRLKANDDQGNRVCLCGNLGTTSGWVIRFVFSAGNEWAINFVWGGEGGFTTIGPLPVLTAGEWHTFGMVFSGSGTHWAGYIDENSSVGGGAARIMADSDEAFAIGAEYDGDANNYGGSWDIDHLIIYPEVALAEADYEAFRAGMMSRPGDAKFWWTGQYTPGRNEIDQIIGAHRNGVPVQTEEAGYRWHWPLVGIYKVAFSGEASDPGGTEEGLMATSMYEELTGRGRVYFCYELDLPDDTKIRASIKSLPTEVGLYGNILENISDITVGGSVEPSYSLRKVTANVKLLDKGRVLAKRFTGEFENLIEGSACRIRLISPHVPAADWFTCFEGVFERWEGRDLLPYMTHFLGINDKPLEGGASLGVISDDVFPDCASYDDVGSEIPAIYGIYDEAFGAKTAMRISETEFLASAGFLSEVTEVFVDGELNEAWTQQNIERSGRNFTEVLFDEDPGVGVDVTFNCAGIEKFGDGSGSPLTNSAEQLLHMIVNWYFGKYERGSWYSASEIGAPINTGHFAQVAEFMRQFGWTSKKTLTKSMTGYQLCNGWSAS